MSASCFRANFIRAATVLMLRTLAKLTTIRLIVDLEEVRVKKAMKTVYSFCIQGTMSKYVVN